MFILDEEKYEKIKKYIIVGVIVVVVLLLLLFIFNLTSCIMGASYKTEEVLTEPTTERVVQNISTKDEIGNYSLDDYEKLDKYRKVSALVEDVPTDDLEEASLEKATIVLSCEFSPYSKYMSESTYSIGLLKDGGYKIEYTINNEKLEVICSYYDATPIVYKKASDFSDEEKEFFKSFGCWEVPLDDGSYSMQVW